MGSDDIDIRRLHIQRRSSPHSCRANNLHWVNQMTPHEQALARIEYALSEEKWFNEDNGFEDKPNPFLLTLKAVLELHKESYPYSWHCEGCNKCDFEGDPVTDYPCSTADLIIKGVLGE